MNEKSTKGKSFEKRREPQVGQQLDNVCDDISDRDISYLITRMPITIQHFLGQLQQKSSKQTYNRARMQIQQRSVLIPKPKS